MTVPANKLIADAKAAADVLMDMLTPLRRPWMCPICQGHGHVPAGFYTDCSPTTLIPEKCRTCGGRGIVIA